MRDLEHGLGHVERAMSGFMLLAEAERALVACHTEIARLRTERDEARVLLLRAGNAITSLEADALETPDPADRGLLEQIGAFLAKVPP
jgi:hypothetical protein